MDYHPVANDRMFQNGCIGMDAAVFANDHMRANNRVRLDDRAGVNLSSGMDGLTKRLVGPELKHDPVVGVKGLFAEQEGFAFGRFHPLVENDNRCCRGERLVEVLFNVYKRNISRPDIVDLVDAGCQNARVADDLGLDHIRDLGYRYGVGEIHVFLN